MKIPYARATANHEQRLHHFLVLVNINTKFCFVERLLFQGKARDDDYRPGKKAPKLAGEQATQRLAVSALDRVLSKRIPRENKQLRSLFPNAPGIQINTIYTDQGSEFGDLWRQKLAKHKIRPVMFKAAEGTKRRMGVVERMIRTLRRYYAVWVHNHPNSSKWLDEVFPQVLIQYN